MQREKASDLQRLSSRLKVGFSEHKGKPGSTVKKSSKFDRDKFMRKHSLIKFSVDLFYLSTIVFQGFNGSSFVRQPFFHIFKEAPISEMDLKEFCASIVSLLVGAFPLMEYFFSSSHLLASGVFQLPNPSYVSN
jgi:hypothetical protein